MESQSNIQLYTHAQSIALLANYIHICLPIVTAMKKKLSNTITMIRSRGLFSMLVIVHDFFLWRRVRAVGGSTVQCSYTCACVVWETWVRPRGNHARPFTGYYSLSTRTSSFIVLKNGFECRTQSFDSMYFCSDFSTAAQLRLGSFKPPLIRVNNRGGIWLASHLSGGFKPE